MNDEVGIGCRSASDWLRGWWEFSGPQSEAKYNPANQMRCSCYISRATNENRE